MAQSIRATKEYLRRKRRLTEWEMSWLSQGVTPRSLPPHLLVKEVEFVRERDFLHKGKALCDYRVHYEDGTYDCVSLAAGMAIPIEGNYFPRLYRVDNYSAWWEVGDEPPKPEIPGLGF